MTDTVVPFLPPIRWQNARIAEIIERTPRIKSFVFELPEPITFRGGQHVDIRLTAEDGYHAMRSYSIASTPGRMNRLELAIEDLPSGEVSPFFHEIVRLGDEIELRGPLGGHFVWTTESGGPLLLVGGGSGVVPLMSMLRHRAAAASNIPAVLLYSVRGWDDVLFRDEMLAIEAAGNGFQLVFAVTRDAPQRPGDFNRRVDGEMMRSVLARLPQAPRHVFVCGSNPFVNAAADGCVAAGVRPEMIRTERYGA